MYVQLNFDREHATTVFGQLTHNGEPIPGTSFFLKAAGDGSTYVFPSAVEGLAPKGMEIAYIQQGHCLSTFHVGPKEFQMGRAYQLPFVLGGPEDEKIGGQSSVSLYDGDVDR